MQSTLPPMQWVQRLFVEVKRPELGLNRPPILSSKVLTGWSIDSRSAPSRHGIQRNFTVLAAFAASRSLLVSPWPSAFFPRVSLRLALDRCQWNFILSSFMKICRENPIRLTEAQMSCTLHEDLRWVQLKCEANGDAREGEWRGKLANVVGSQYSSHYLGTRCTQHYYRWCAHLDCQ